MADEDPKKRKPIDLNALITTKELGKTTVKIALEELVAKPGFAPKKWQANAPDCAYDSHSMPVENSDDLRRIAELPRRAPTEPDTERASAMIQLITQRYGHDYHKPGGCACAAIGMRFKGRPLPCITELNLAQAWGLFEIGLVGGLLGIIGVGHGKTIMDLLAPLAFKGCRLGLLLVPPGLVVQLIREHLRLGEHFKVPSLILHGTVKLPILDEKTGNVTLSPATPYHDFRFDPVTGEDMPALHVLPYSRLQRPESTIKLEEIHPDVMIADEAHKLRRADTATVGRVLRFFDANEATRFAGWSGSLSDKSIKDYAHLAALALREGSPLPTNAETVEDWSRALDPRLGNDDDEDERPDDEWRPWRKAAPPGALMLLCAPGEHVAQGFHRRLVETPGVISTKNAPIDAEMVIEERKAPPLPRDISDAMDVLRETWVRPDGEQLIDALTVARTLRELACGFHYYWHFPDGESRQLIDYWKEKRKLYRQEVYYQLRRRAPHMDSPKLCQDAAMRFHGDMAPRDDLPMWESEHWPDWRDVRGKVKPVTRAYRMNDFLARDAAQWGQENRGIIWYDSGEIGRWVCELSAELGQPLVRYGGGPEAARLIARDTGKRSIICSLKSHGTGRDGLQEIFDDQLMLQPLQQADGWEQLLGRLHRIGQLSPVVRARFYRHTPELARHVDTALARALYLQITLGSMQKLRVGFIDPNAIAAIKHEQPERAKAADILAGLFDEDTAPEDDGEPDDEGSEE